MQPYLNSSEIRDIRRASLHPTECLVRRTVNEIDGPLVSEHVAEERKSFEILTDSLIGGTRWFDFDHRVIVAAARYMHEQVRLRLATIILKIGMSAFVDFAIEPIGRITGHSRRI